MKMVDIRRKVKKHIDRADDRTVRMLYSTLKNFIEEDNWWKQLSVSVRQSIIKAEKELKAGKGIPHEEVMKKYGI
jgi:hypothetical protein